MIHGLSTCFLASQTPTKNKIPTLQQQRAEKKEAARAEQKAEEQIFRAQLEADILHHLKLPRTRLARWMLKRDWLLHLQPPSGQRLPVWLSLYERKSYPANYYRQMKEKEIDWVEGERRIRVRLVCCTCNACRFFERIKRYNAETYEQEDGFRCIMHNKDVHPQETSCKDFQ